MAAESYRDCFRHAPYGVFLIDGAGRYLDVNPGACRLTGYTEEQLLTMSIADLVAPERRGMSGERLGTLVATGRLTADTLCQRADGSRVWFELHARKIEDDRYVGFTFDVTERRRLVDDLAARVEEIKHSKDALRESEERFRAFYEASFEGIVITDRGTIVDINDRCAEMLGYQREEMLGQQVAPLMVAPEDAELVAERMRSRYEQPYQHKALRSDGTRIDVEVCGRTVQLDGRPVRITAIHDVTERVKAENERLALVAQVQHAQKLESLGILAGGIAHDFNNLLVGILGNADLALIGLPPDSPVRQEVVAISTNARRCAELTNQMLAYSGKGSFAVEEVDLRGLIDELINLIRSSLSKKVTLELALSPELPRIRADRSQVHQVFLNLATNASEAIGDTTGRIVVTGRAVDRESLAPLGCVLLDELPPGPCVMLEVSDNGSGMTADTRDRVFEPFFTTKFTGRGLGMAAVHGIVRAHRGRIEVETEPGVGTRFRVSFPALHGDRGAETVAADSAAEWRGSGTVLLVDDEEVVREVGTRALDYLGFDVLVSHDGAHALEVLGQHRDEVVCVLLDLKMPNLDGEETLLAMRRIHEDVPVILCSGYGETEASARCVEAGLSGFLQKPYEIQALRAKLREVLG